jgi:hypothetical protein
LAIIDARTAQETCRCPLCVALKASRVTRAPQQEHCGKYRQLRSVLRRF